MYTDKIPPHDEEAEEAVLGSLLIEGDAFVRISEIVQPRDFYRERNRWTYQACLAIFERGEAIDQVTVAHEMAAQEQLEPAGGHAFLSHLVNSVPTSVHADHYAEVVSRASTMRRLINAGTTIAGMGFDHDGDVAKTLSEAEDLLFGVRGRQRGTSYIPLRTILDQYMEESASMMAPTPGSGPIATGFVDLDRLLGGLHPATLFILAARPSVGKSTLAMNIARYAAAIGNHVGIASLEMGRMEIAYRLISAEAEVDSQRLRMNLVTDRESNRISDAVGDLSDLSLFIDDTPGLSISDIRTRARRLQLEEGVNLLVVDYIQLVHGTRRDNNRVAEMTEVSGILKEMARDMNIPVLAVSQLSRAVENRPGRRPQLSDLRDSGAIEQDADVVAFMYRADANFSEEEWDVTHGTTPYPKNITEIIIGKQRNGPTGSIQLYSRLNFARFENFMQPEAQDAG